MAATGTNTWTVGSENGHQEYTVCLEQERCTQDCALECTQCNICLHMYSCACYDHLIHATICKHIHLVAMTLQSESPPQDQSGSSITEDTEVILEAVKQPNPLALGPGRSRLLGKLENLSALVMDCSTTEALTAVEKHIAAALSVLKAIELQAGGVLPQVPNVPSNKKMTIQRFQSTKKKRKSAKVRLAKPSNEEKATIVTSLLSGATTACPTTEEVTG